jgi:predicted membrane GTPase involved in stress response
MVRLIVGIVSQLGFMTEVRTETRGSAVVNRVFQEYSESAGHIESLFKGKLISMDQGSATAYALNMIEERGQLFIEPGNLTSVKIALYDRILRVAEARAGAVQARRCMPGW